MAFYDTLKNVTKKVIKYTSPISYAADVAKDRYESGKLPGGGLIDNALGIQPASQVLADTTGTAYTPPDGFSQDLSKYLSSLGGTPTGTGTGTGSTDNSALYRDQFLSKLGTLNTAYNDLFGSVDNVVKDRASQLSQNYDQQLTDFNKAYQNNTGQLAGAYGARGLADSSYFQTAQNDSADTYNRTLDQLMKDRANSEAQLGQYAANSKANLSSALNQFNAYKQNLPNYTAADLQGLLSQIDSALANVGVQKAGLGTNQDFINGLQKITPTQQQGTAQLASQLQQLVTSGAPRFAKKQIAQGLIKSAQLTDPNAVGYWNNYFEQLLNQQA